MLRFDKPGLRRHGLINPLGTTPDGVLVVEIDDGTNYNYLGTISPTGALEVTEPMGYTLTPPFVDRSGVLHIFWEQGRWREYEQRDMTSPGLPVVLELDYDQPAVGPTPTPDYLKWYSGSRGRQLETAMFSEEDDVLVVATLRPHRGLDTLGLYRIDSKTLVAMDSGALDLSADVYRTWVGPVLPRNRIVPAADYGYWFVAPTNRKPPEPTTVAYRLRDDLSVVSAPNVSTDSAADIAEAPPGAVMMPDCHYTRPTQTREAVRVTVELDMTAFDEEGRLYCRTFIDSLTSRRPPKQDQ